MLYSSRCDLQQGSVGYNTGLGQRSAFSLLLIGLWLIHLHIAVRDAS